MDTPPPDDRDLRLARRLDAGEAADGSDPLGDALDALRPEAAGEDPDVSDRLWAGIAAQTAPRRAPDRAPRRGLRRVRVRTWAAAAAVAFAAGMGLWVWSASPELVASAGSEVATYDAPDGSTITLRPNSRLYRLRLGRAYRLEGEARFAVASDPERPFIVEANVATVRVLGTQFVVSTWGAQTDVFVEEGRVEVNGERSGVLLGAGEAARVTAEAVETILDPSAEAATDWLRNEAVFARVPVRRALDEIGQHFGVVITLPRAVEDQAISGSVPLDSAAEALDAVGRILDGRFVPEGGGFRFEIR